MALIEPTLQTPAQKYGGTAEEFAAFKIAYPVVPPCSEYWVSDTNIIYKTADGKAASWILFVTLS